jgi:capsular exopolysaccharide synthesis family protein
MGRIDEALRRAAARESAGATPVPAPTSNPPGDVFSSPWSFEGESEARPSGGASTPPPALLQEAAPQGRMALFRGFHPDLIGRIVAAPGASPILTEQFRRLAATLHHAQLVQGTKIVMVTSANQGDGKTLTSANLALTLSESYRRQVLLIDADLRRPSLHEVFQVPNVAGLNDGLKSRQDAKLAVIKITEQLTLLPAGQPDPDPMSGLTSARMGEILREGASRFDWIIVDTAPLGLLTDANLLATFVDGALLVIRADQTPYDAVHKAVESLGRQRLLGVVLNGVEPREKENEYYYYSRPTSEATSTAVARQD